MKLHALFTVEYNVPVSGAVRRRIRVRQRPGLNMPQASSAKAALPLTLPLPLPQAVWLTGVGLACAMVLVGLRLTPDEPAERGNRAEPVASGYVTARVVEPAPALSPALSPVSALASAPAPAPLVDERVQDEAVRHAVLRWADAWSRRDVSNYLAAYSLDYTGQAGNRAVWERERRSRIEARRHIQVDLSELEIEGGTDMVRVTFSQSYRSDALQETTRKTLTLMRDGQDRWLIVRES